MESRLSGSAPWSEKLLTSIITLYSVIERFWSYTTTLPRDTFPIAAATITLIGEPKAREIRLQMDAVAVVISSQLFVGAFHRDVKMILEFTSGDATQCNLELGCELFISVTSFILYFINLFLHY